MVAAFCAAPVYAGDIGTPYKPISAGPAASSPAPAADVKADQALLDKARALRDSLEDLLRKSRDVSDDLDGMRSGVRRIKDKRDDGLELRICDRNLRMRNTAESVVDVADALKSLAGSAVADYDLRCIASDINDDAVKLYRLYDGEIVPGAEGLYSDVDGLGDALMGDAARAAVISLRSKARDIGRSTEDIKDAAGKFYDATRD